MKTKDSPVDGNDLAVLIRGKGFSCIVRRFLGDALAARRKRRAMEDLAGLPPHLQRDIDWPPLANHEKH